MNHEKPSALYANMAIVAFLAVVILALSTLFVVFEGRQALVSRFGKLQTDNGKIVIYQPGIHLHIPLIL